MLLLYYVDKWNLRIYQVEKYYQNRIENPDTLKENEGVYIHFQGKYEKEMTIAYLNKNLFIELDDAKILLKGLLEEKIKYLTEQLNELNVSLPLKITKTKIGDDYLLIEDLR